MQGQLQDRPLSGAIHTTCACCGEAMCIEFDSELNCHSQQADATPVISTPMVNIPKLEAPNIIDDF